jgi:hypothetical protein
MKNHVGRKCIVVRRCTGTFSGKEHEFWPATMGTIFPSPEGSDPNIIHIGEEGGSRPFATVPKHAANLIPEKTGHCLYVVTKVLSSKRFLMKEVTTGMTEEATLQEFPEEIQKSDDPIATIQDYAYLKVPLLKIPFRVVPAGLGFPEVA